MNCQKCSGLMVADHDPESPTGIRCINCGSQGAIAMTTEPKTDRQTNCGKPNCPDPKAEDSVYCARHRDMKRAANEKAAAKKNGGAPPAPKKAIVVRAASIGVKVAAADPIGKIDAAIARRLAEIETLLAAKALIES